MKTATFFSALITLLPALIASTPVKRQSAMEFIMIATHSGDPRVHLQSIDANNNSFWIGKPTCTSCPDPPVTDCPPGNVTVLSAPANLTFGISTSHEVPGEQMIYISGATDNLPGSLAFNPAHSAVPSDGIIDQFEFDGSNLVYTGGDWWACPAYGAYYVQSATSSPNNDCIGIAIDTFPYSGPSPAAWEYD